MKLITPGCPSQCNIESFNKLIKLLIRYGAQVCKKFIPILIKFTSAKSFHAAYLLLMYAEITVYLLALVS